MLTKSNILFPDGNLFSNRGRKNFFNELTHEGFFNQLFKEEFERLDEKGDVYLDYAESSVFPFSIVQKHFNLLQNSTFNTPGSATGSSGLLERTRVAILNHFKAHEYHCVFTHNLSDAMDIVGQNYPFGQLLLLADNHHSYNQLSFRCECQQGQVDYALLNQDLSINSAELRNSLQSFNQENKLFVFSAQSDVSGIKHDLDWVQEATAQGWDVLLDVDSFAQASNLNLSKTQPAFVALSFHKMFGYPAGVSCLLVHKDQIHRLISGGQQKSIVSRAEYHLVCDHSRFEDKSIDYLSIPAVKFGLDFHKEIGIMRLESRVQSMGAYLLRNLKRIKHSSGIPVVRLIGPNERSVVEGTVLMKFQDAVGKHILSVEVKRMASDRYITIGAGNFVNPGVLQSIQAYASTEEHLVPNSYNELVAQYNNLRDVVRVSVGVSTRKKDLDVFLDFVRSMKDSVV